MGNICNASEERGYTYVKGGRDIRNVSREEVIVIQWED